VKFALQLIAALTVSACAVKTAQPSHEPAKVVEQPSSEAHAEIKGVEPETSLHWLTNGNTRFMKHRVRKDGQSSTDIARLSGGQQPHAVVLSCSDSRVPPEIVFDQKLGEIFTVRTAGEALGHNAIGSIEYAVEHLGTRLIVVMGHTSCGAVAAAYGTLDGKSAGTPSLDELVGDIHPRLAAFKGQPPSESFEKESWANAQGVASDLLTRSKMLSEMKAHGKIKIVSALYDLKTGQVTFREN
jgi:carbonic anhydrase